MPDHVCRASALLNSEAREWMCPPFITRPWGFCDTRKSSVRQKPSDFLSALVFLFVSIICLSPSLSLCGLFISRLVAAAPPLWGENSSPVSAEKRARSSKNTMECSDGSRLSQPKAGRSFLRTAFRRSRVLFIQQQVTTKVISWHFPNTAALDIGRTRQSQHVVMVADCVWGST